MFHHHLNFNELLCVHEDGAPEASPWTCQWRWWIFPTSSNRICEFPLRISWLAKERSLTRIQRGTAPPSFSLFKFLQPCSSRGSLRGHLKCAMNFSLFRGKSQRHSSKDSCVAARNRWDNFLCAQRSRETTPWSLLPLGRVSKGKLCPMSFSP